MALMAVMHGHSLIECKLRYCPLHQDRILPPMTDRSTPYLFIWRDPALCATCLRVVQAKEIIRRSGVSAQALFRSMVSSACWIADDAAYGAWT